ncbi:MAG: carbohydate-binding domain-containing protein [Aliidongia sp.]
MTGRAKQIDRREFLTAAGLSAALLMGGGRRLLAAMPPGGSQLAIGFEVLSNGFSEGRFISELTLTNHAVAALPRSDWALYFNASALPQAEPGAGIAIEHIDGDLVRLAPTADFVPLGPGETRRFRPHRRRAGNLRDRCAGGFLPGSATRTDRMPSPNSSAIQLSRPSPGPNNWRGGRRTSCRARRPS